jgi:hypothetical protein
MLKGMQKPRSKREIGRAIVQPTAVPLICLEACLYRLEAFPDANRSVNKRSRLWQNERLRKKSDHGPPMNFSYIDQDFDRFPGVTRLEPK